MTGVAGGRWVRGLWCASLIVPLLLSFLSACTSVGPCTVPKDRFGYGNALSRSSKEQVLHNLVRLRYLEAPVFLDVSSVINQYSLESSASAALGTGSGFIAGDTRSVAGAAKWVDRPTITYVPLSGAKFSRSILTPLTPESLFALVQSGWPPEIVLGLTVRSINGIRNDTASPSSRQTADPKFWKLLDAWGRLRNAGAVALRLDEDQGKRNLVVFSREAGLGEAALRDLDFLRSTLGLQEDEKEYRMAYGLMPVQPNEIAVLTRSTFEIMSNLAWYIEAPAAHICEGRTGPAFRGQGGAWAPVIRARVSAERPEGAFVAVRDRGFWFYIDDADMASKRIFTVLEIIMSLADRGDAARGPVISIGS